MTRSLKITAADHGEGVFEIPSSLLESTPFPLEDKAVLHFGAKSCLVKVRRTQRKEATLSQDCTNELLLPLEIQGELRFSGNDIFIGPFVGILAAKKEKNLSGNLKKWKKILRHSPEGQGIVMVFSLDGIQEKDLRIEGYLYNYQTHEWVKGIYPYPNAIYKRMALNRRLLNHLKENIGNNIINEATFSKWKVYQYLCEEEELSPYLPLTKRYTSPKEVIELANSYKSIFLKPINGSFGKNAYQITVTDKSLYVIRKRSGGKNHTFTLTAQKLEEFLTQHLGRKKYIVQQKLDITFRNHRVIDYRLYLSKETTGDWQCTGWVAKAGKPHSIVSNHSSGGSVENAEETLQECLNGDKELARKNKKIAHSIACKAAALLEKNSGKRFGYFGVDLAVDTNGRLWIIEMNHRYVDDKLPLSIGDRALYEKIQTSYLSCLRFLSGF